MKKSPDPMALLTAFIFAFFIILALTLLFSCNNATREDWELELASKEKVRKDTVICDLSFDSNCGISHGVPFDSVMTTYEITTISPDGSCVSEKGKHMSYIYLNNR